MKRTIIACILLLSLSPLFAQNQSDSIVIKKAFGTVFKQNGKILTPRQLSNITQMNASAFKEMSLARDNYTAASVIGAVGGFMVGWPMGTAMAGGDANWAMAGIGAGLIVVSIPFDIAFIKHAKKAVGIYNSGLKQTQTGMNKIEFKMAMTCNGIGIKMRF